MLLPALMSISDENTIETPLTSESYRQAKFWAGKCVEPDASFCGRNKFF